MYKDMLLLLAGSMAATRVAGNCMHGTSLYPRAVGGTVEVNNFGYTGALGPQNWASLAAENIQCSTGTGQSPINIDAAIGTLEGAPTIDFPSVEAAEFENLGTTIEVIVNGTTNVLGADFALKQFHFHSPSEHRINEEYFPLEMHMVHEAANGDIAVMAVLFDLSADATTSLLTSVMASVNDIATPGTVTETGALDFTELIAHLTTTPLRQYTGSLTTPPCAEGLTFLVTEQPLPIDVATFNAAKKVIKFNSRYTQNTPGEQNILAVAFDTVSKAGVDFAAPPAESAAPPAESAAAAPVESGVAAPAESSAPADPAASAPANESAPIVEDAAPAAPASEFLCVMGACERIVTA